MFLFLGTNPFSKTVARRPPNNHQDRENIMSFGPLMKVGELSTSPMKTNDNKNPEKGQKSRQSPQPKLDGESKPQRSSKGDDEANLSLVSYEETDEEENKYYNEEELTNILGCASLNKSKYLQSNYFVFRN